MVSPENTNWIYGYGLIEDIPVPDANFSAPASGFRLQFQPTFDGSSSNPSAEVDDSIVDSDIHNDSRSKKRTPAIAMMGYGPEDKNVILELTYSYGVTEYDKGNTYAQDQKKLQGQLIAEQEAMFGSKPSPMKQQSGKKGSKMSSGGPSNRRLSLGGAMHAPKADLHYIRATHNTRHSKKNQQ
ncbi:hypothetical protein SSX86_019820 [Deinandra increscens subsp. villosa]|uniref:Uncharacterized protein n=1 Tax=Deinandra increscens subsp. villosa TaxID=3103831 RepID=A0AAP0CYF8_9ASTR